MTSASELFYTRRSRFGRSSDPFSVESDFGSHTSLDRGSRRQRHQVNSQLRSCHTLRDRVDPDGSDQSRRALRQPSLHRSSHSPHDRDFIRLEHDGHQFASGNGTRSGGQNIAQDSARFTENDRLPGAVLLARERLSRRLSRITLSSSRNNQSDRNELFLVDAGDWETDIYRGSTDPRTSKRPPGLSEEAMNRLQIEVFCAPEDVSRATNECSICLESFVEGDVLMHLPCGHRYHLCCLDPWVRTCGDCPYCRRDILVSTDGTQ